MIVRQYAPCSLGRSIICLGKQGEINALRVEFDVSAWMAMYPDATVKLMHFAPDRPQDNPVIPTLGVEGTLRVWIVGEEDTAGAGNGVIELLLIDERTGSTIKSATGYTTVLRSPSAGIEAQEAEAGYVRYDIDQSALLTDEQKAVARKNIGAGTGDDTGSGGILKETDPTVPDWAKQPSKPTYTAGEVGARPDSWTPSASDVGADAAGTASGAVAAHNTSGAAHADLRALIEGLTSRLNALADSDDTTLDQLSEIVAYIKSNRTLIDAVTTGKVSVSDIVDNLTTNASGKVLSAAQGVALKAMIDGIVIPTALPNPQPITINGQRYDGSEAVTVTVSSEGGGTPVEIDGTLTQSGKAADAKAVGDQLSALNAAKANNDDLAAVAKSGSYTDLSNKPTIPTVPESLKNPNKLTFTGAVTAEYDGSSEVSVEIPAGGSGGYTLPIASATQLGGVMPAAKTDEMTQAVGVDEAGGLWTLPGGSGGTDGQAAELLISVTTEERVAAIMAEFNPAKYRKIMAIAKACGHADNGTAGYLQTIALRDSTGKYIKFVSPAKVAQEATLQYSRWDIDLADGLAMCYTSKSANGGESWASDNSGGSKGLQALKISTNELTGVALANGGGSAYENSDVNSSQTFEVGAYIEAWGIRA